MLDDKIYKKEIKINGENYLINQAIPNNFIIGNDNVLYKILTTKNAEIRVIFSIGLVFIKSILENISTMEQKVEILFYRPQIEQWQTIIVDKNILSDTRLIVSLANKGIPINSSNAKDWL
jgi:hypothetical protein